MGSAKILVNPMFLSHLKELQEFFEHDWNDLVRNKGGKKALKKEEVTMKGHMGRQTFSRPATLYFYDEVNRKNDPVEEVALDSWKRDDIKELLNNLLPDDVGV